MAFVPSAGTPSGFQLFALVQVEPSPPPSQMDCARVVQARAKVIANRAAIRIRLRVFSFMGFSSFGSRVRSRSGRAGFELF